MVVTIGLLLACCLLGLPAWAYSWPELKEDVIRHPSLQGQRVAERLRALDTKRVERSGLPTLTLQANTEYQRGLQGGSNTVVVGDSVLPGNTAFQQSVSLNAQVTVWDFGKRRLRAEVSRSAALEAGSDTTSRARELLEQALGAYVSLWQAQALQQIEKEQVALARERVEALQRLQKAGRVGQLDVASASLEWVEAQQALEVQERAQQLARAELSVFKGLAPDERLTPIELLLPSAATVEQHPELLQLDEAIEAKQQEVQLLTRERWMPTIQGYGRYVLFGSDVSNPVRSIDRLEPQTLRVGVSVSMPLFDGFQHRMDKKQSQLELNALTFKREERYRALKSLKARSQWESPSQGLGAAETLNEMGERLEAVRRVSALERFSQRQRVLQQRRVELEAKAQEQLSAGRLDILGVRL